MGERYIDPNSGAAPQPGANVGAPLQSVKEFAKAREEERLMSTAHQVEDQDEGTEVTEEEQEAALLGQAEIAQGAVPQGPQEPPAESQAGDETATEEAEQEAEDGNAEAAGPEEGVAPVAGAPDVDPGLEAPPAEGGDTGEGEGNDANEGEKEPPTEEKALEDMTKAELEDVAKDRDLEGYSTMNKAELLRALKAQES